MWIEYLLCRRTRVIQFLLNFIQYKDNSYPQANGMLTL